MSEPNEISQIPFSSASISAVTWMLKTAATSKFRKEEKPDHRLEWGSAEHLGKAEGLVNELLEPKIFARKKTNLFNCLTNPVETDVVLVLDAL